MDSSEKMYSVKEVSALTGWSNDTIRRLIYRRKLRAVVLPGTGGSGDGGGNGTGRRRTRIYRSTRVSDSALREFLKTNQNY